MRITDIREASVSLAAPMENAGIAFDGMTASAVAIDVDFGSGQPVTGYGFSSIGRYAQGGLIRERFAPRLLAASDLAGSDGIPDPVRARATMMANEKPGGDGDRAGAVGVLDMALWDAAAKAQDVPLWSLLSDLAGASGPSRIPVYATGGHYYETGNLEALRDEIRSCLDLGFHRIKIKCGRDGIRNDCARIEAVLPLLGDDGRRLAVDVNCACDSPDDALSMLAAYSPYGLAWIEEPCHPHDFVLLEQIARHSTTPIATGENLFSFSEAANLVRYGGLCPDRDVIQIDPALSYGLVEYRNILAMAADKGWAPTRFFPHAGHLLSFHAVAGLGLGAHEVAPRTDSPMTGLPAGIDLLDGAASRPEAPGLGFETHTGLWSALQPVVTSS